MHMLETVKLGRPYSGVNFELQLLLHVHSEMQIGEAHVIFAGEVKQQCVSSKVRCCFQCFSLGTGDKSETSERFAGHNEQKLGMHASVKRGPPVIRHRI